jgi:hypothetical protein
MGPVPDFSGLFIFMCGTLLISVPLGLWKLIELAVLFASKFQYIG